MDVIKYGQLVQDQVFITSGLHGEVWRSSVMLTDETRMNYMERDTVNAILIFLALVCANSTLGEYEQIYATAKFGFNDVILLRTTSCGNYAAICAQIQQGANSGSITPYVPTCICTTGQRQAGRLFKEYN
ncbi:hypothetical protein Fcan01_26097 [Folsomia candida]|uniref:Uncharacterized protein n=1 Tax=Folsomia candida TaxID=158441 RepID=A0A226D4H5_FOLCA|nr:hypothetical protein Fcan01_26097 [Folsomia candida]